MAHPRIQMVGFFGNFNVSSEITEFEFALNTFDRFRFFYITFSSSHDACCFRSYSVEIFQTLVMILAASYPLCTIAANKLRGSCKIEIHLLLETPLI